MKIEKLQKGDMVAIVSLSSGILGEKFIEHELELGVKRIRELGLVPIFMKNSLKGLDFIKNNPDKRFEDLKNAFLSDEIKMIITAIGGDDSYRLLPYIFGDEEFKDIVKNNPKIFIGYSDTTTTHLALNKLGLNTFYGPAFITDFAEFENDMLPYTKKCLNYLFDAPEFYEIKPSEFWYDERTDFSPSAVGTNRIKHEEKKGFEFIKGSGIAEGKLYGGCIEVLYKLTQDKAEKITEDHQQVAQITEKFPIVLTNEELSDKVLFIETSDGKPTKEDYTKMIKHLKKIGMFNNIKGLIVGKPMDETYYDEYISVLLGELSEYNFPIVTNMNFGHSFPRMVLPIGAEIKINCDLKTINLKSSTLI